MDAGAGSLQYRANKRLPPMKRGAFQLCGAKVPVRRRLRADMDRSIDITEYDCERFSRRACRQRSLGRRPAVQQGTLVTAHSGSVASHLHFLQPCLTRCLLTKMDRTMLKHPCREFARVAENTGTDYAELKIRRRPAMI